MIYPIGTIATLANKDGGLDEIYVGREVTVLSTPAPIKATNRHGQLCEYEAYGCEVEGEENVMYAKHAWLVPKSFPKDEAFEKFKIEMLKPIDLKIMEES